MLELIIADAYQCGKVNTSEVRQLLNLSSRLEAHAFLKRMGVYLNYDEDGLEQDLQTLKELPKDRVRDYSHTLLLKIRF